MCTSRKVFAKTQWSRKKHNKIIYLSCRLIAVRDNVRWYKIFGGLFITFADFFNAIKLNTVTSGNQCQTDNFENLRNIPSSDTEDILLYNACDPDNNFFNINVHNLNTAYILPENF